MSEPLCHHGHVARECTQGMHTVWRHCPAHLVGWSVLRESGCWWTDEDGGPCRAPARLGEPPSPRGDGLDRPVAQEAS